MTTAVVQQIRSNDTNIIEIESFEGLPGRIQMSIEPKLDVEYNEAMRTLKRFQELVPSNDRVSLRDQGLRDVLRVVEDAVRVWTSCKQKHLFQKSISLAASFMRTLDAHHAIVPLLPPHQDYPSLFCSILQSVIKASTRQYKVAEGFLASLVEINEAVQSSVKQLQNRASNPIPQVAHLYCQIFLFLGEFMNSYIAGGNCRVLYSHNEDFQADFRGLIQNIKYSAHAIVPESNNYPNPFNQRHLRRSSAEELDYARLRQAGLYGSDRKRVAESTIVLQIICDIQQYNDQRKSLTADRKTLLDKLISSLQTHLPADEQVRPTADWTVSMNSTQENDIQPSPALASPPGTTTISRRKLTRSGLLCDSRDLQDWFSNDDQIREFGPDLRLLVDPDIAVTLYDWTQTPRSQLIAISTPHSVALPGNMTLISACYVSLARQNKIPVISHFCSLLPARGASTRTEQGLIALAYSLIRQLIELAPPVLDCDSTFDLSADRFHRLDGTTTLWTEVLSVLDMLLYFAPPILFCVIDGLDLLDDDSTKIYIQLLVDILVRHTSDQPPQANRQIRSFQGGLLKVLFTTAAVSQSLQRSLDRVQMIRTNSLRVEEIVQPCVANGNTDTDTDMAGS